MKQARQRLKQGRRKSDKVFLGEVDFLRSWEGGLVQARGVLIQFLLLQADALLSAGRAHLLPRVLHLGPVRLIDQFVFKFS